MNISTKKFLFALAGLALVVAVSAAPAQAALWGTHAGPGDLIGARDSFSLGGASTGHGGNKGDDWAGNFAISWVITQNNGAWTYTYTISGESNAISHFILEVTDNGEAISILPGSSINSTAEIRTYSGTERGNPGLPNDFYGVKFDYAAQDDDSPWMGTYTIVTDRAPVYGVFYAKAGGTKNYLAAWSDALNYADYKTNDSIGVMSYIVRPNGGPSAVPIPGAVWLLGTGLLGVIGLRRRGK